MLMAATESGPEAVAGVVALIATGKDRIAAMDAVLTAGNAAITTAFSALVMAGEKIPNTAPPARGGFELAGAPAD